jgi:phosphoglycolate phosphatase
MSLELPSCILFDLDGTLVDSLPGIELAVRKAFSMCGIPLLTDSLRDLIGPPIRTILSRAGNVADGNALDALERAFRRSYDDEGWRTSSCYPEARLVLQTIQDRGHRAFVISNKPRHISLLMIEREDILKYFEAVVTRDSRSPNYTSKGQMIETLLDERSIAHEQCVMVGDTLEDATAAGAAGIKFIFMDHGYGKLPQTPSIPIWCRLDNFSHLLSSMTKETVVD